MRCILWIASRTFVSRSGERRTGSLGPRWLLFIPSYGKGAEEFFWYFFFWYFFFNPYYEGHRKIFPGAGIKNGKTFTSGTGGSKKPSYFWPERQTRRQAVVTPQDAFIKEALI